MQSSNWLKQRYKLALISLPLLLALSSGAARADILVDPSPSCDPSKQSCVPGSGGGGGGSTPCTPARQALGLCTPPTLPPGGGGGGGGGTCSPPGNGNPSCGGAGPASQGGGGGGGVQVGGGNPIHLISGNKYQEETDLAALPGVLGLELKRYYNSLSSNPGLLGVQWRMSYETVLHDLGQQIQIVQADGRRLSFAKQPGRSLCVSPQPGDGQVRIEALGEGKVRYHWRWPDGRTLSFGGGSQGGQPLQSIRAASGEQVQLSYSPLGDLLSVRDPQGRQLSFVYGRAGAGQRPPLLAIQTPLGRIHYSQDSQGRLSEVAYAFGGESGPGQTATGARLYHYEAEHQAGNAWALTGISLRQQDPKTAQVQTQRLASYTYEASGRAILSSKGQAQQRDAAGQVVAGTGIEQISLQYVSRPLPTEGRPDSSGEVQARSVGKTVLTNSLGQKTELLSAVIGGQYRLLQSLGPGCASCGPANMSYGYDSAGRLIRASQLDAQGRPLQAELRRYDGQGRLVETARQSYQAGKPQPTQWLQRYAYSDIRYADGSMALGQQPTRITQPSVIAGQTRSTELAYNALGQLTRVTERGWSPVDAEGKEAPSALERSTTYRYTMLAGKSLLTEIDGPLANGPKGLPEDSDVTRFSWDAKGAAITEAQAPGGMRWHYDHNELGLLKEQTLDDGYRRVQTRWEWASFGMRSAQPLRIDRKAWQLQDGKTLEASLREQQVLHARYDGLGRRTAIMQNGGIGEEMSYDAIDRPLTLSDAQGQRLSWAYDIEGRLLAELEQDPAGQVLHARAWLRDAQGRLLATLVPGRIEQLHGLTPPPGLVTAKLTQRMPDVEESAAQRLRLTDDFGRVVLQRDPEDGRISTSFEVGLLDGRSVEIQRQRRTGLDGKSQTQETITFDMAGRLILRERGDAHGACVDHLRYEGRLLTQLQACTADERYERDAFGLITRRQMQLPPSGAGFDEHYRYDKRSRLSERLLPDGQVLRYAYAEEAQLAANTAPTISRLRPWLSRLHGQHPGLASALARWLPEHWGSEALLSGAQIAHRLHTADQLMAVTHGNGEQTSWTRPQARPIAAGQRQIVAMMQPGAESSSQPALQAPVDVDAFGRQTRLIPADGPHKGQVLLLQWNAQHQLASVRKEQGQPVADYAYDAAGNRIRKTVYDSAQHPTVTLFRYDTQYRLTAQADWQGKVQRQFLYTDHRAHTVLQGDEALAMHTDWRGLPQRLSDADATTRWQGRFAAGGQLQSNLLPADPGLRLAGQVLDEETGLHYNVHRYYDPVNTRYISPDPLGASDGPARYAYVRGRPMDGIDPLGLFAIPAGLFLGKDPLNEFWDLGNDGGHGDIVRLAFALYQKDHGQRFSDQFIDWVVRNNYHADVNGSAGCYPVPWTEGGGQCNKKNHFDNPNDGPKYKDADMKELMPGYADGNDDNWVQAALDQVKANRMSYANAVFGQRGGVDISFILSAFGQNTHALADFYAHTNWVDDASRGGCVHNTSVLGDEKGYVPKGLAKREIWDETPSSLIFSGTVAGTNRYCMGPVGDVSCSQDKTTHGYWAKDDGKEEGGKQDFLPKDTVSAWEVQIFNENLKLGKFGINWFGEPGATEAEVKKGDRIYVKTNVKNMHQYAFHLAVQHTMQEIERLYSDAAQREISGFKLQDIFKMDRVAMNANNVSYDGKHSKL